MQGSIQSMTLSGYDCTLYLPPGYASGTARYPVVYWIGGEDPEQLATLLEPHFGLTCKAFLLLAVRPKDWNDDCTPWPAPPLRNGEKSFGGHACTFLDSLSGSAKPFLDAGYRTLPEPESTVLLGYSLGGLTALFALHVSGTFGKIGCLSGSLWYDGWMAFMETHRPVRQPDRVYLSLGIKEENSRNPRMGKVGDNTRQTAKQLAGHVASPEHFLLEWNEGGHFREVMERHERALSWLMKE